MPLEGSWTALGDSWKALGRLLEASKRHLGLKPMKGRIFGGFLENFENFGRPCWRRFSIKNRNFLGSQEGIQDKADFGSVFASIFGRFSRVWERQK